jgi:hypothetical protein
MPAIDRALTPGYRLNARASHRNLYRLTAILLSYMALEKSRDRLVNLRDQFVDDELSHLLVQTANANRLQREHMHLLRTDPNQKGFEPVEGDCGAWDWPTDPWKPVKMLSFKDACDKIIHAQEVGMICFDPPSLFLKRRALWEKVGSQGGFASVYRTLSQEFR